MRGRRPLVGRASEVAILRRAAHAATRSRGAVVVVGGEAGVGKTALVREALARSPLVVLGGGSVDAAVPFAPLVAAVRAHPGWPSEARRVLDPGWLPFVRPLLPEIDPVDAPVETSAQRKPDGPLPLEARQAQIEAMRHLVVALARSSPAALVVDDLQRVDAATLAVLEALARSLRREPLLVACTYRSDELPRGSELRRWLGEVRRLPTLHEIALGPLDETSVSTLARRVLGAAPEPGLVAWLAARTGGLPLFVEELAAALKADRALRTDEGRIDLPAGDVRLPESLRDAVLARLERLGPDVRDALAVAAVAGNPVPEELVGRALVELGFGREVASAWPEAGLTCGILQATADGLSFRHDLVREALAGELRGTCARAAHAAIAARLAGAGAEPLVVAEHWLAAGEVERASPAFAAAGEASRRVHAYPDAAAAYRRALALAPASEPAVELSLLERLADCLEPAGEVAEAAELFERAARGRAERNEQRAAGILARRCASLLELRGRWEHAIEIRGLAAAWFAESDEPGEAAAERLAAAAHLRSAAAFTAARELLATALPEARAAGRKDLEARIVGLDGNVLSRMGRAQEGLEQVRQGLELALGEGLAAPSAELYQRLADSLEHAGEYAVARAAYLEGAEYCRRQSIEPAAQLCLACLGVVLFQTGDWATAERTCRDVLSSGRGTPHAIAVAEGVLGLVAAMRGSVSRARPHLLASLALARHIDLAAMELISLAGLARCDEAENDPDGAAERCRELLRRWEVSEERHYSVPLLRWAASFHARRGDVEATRACAGALARVASETGQPDSVAALGAALGEAAMLAGDPRGAADHFVAALELIAARDLPVERAELGWRAGMALVEADRRGEGLAALVDAHRTARRLGAVPLARRIAEDLRQLGEPVERRLGRREARRLATGGLTRREVEVLGIVAAGHTSRSIGELLFISPRTAEMHVASAIAKLDCRTRAEAAHRAASLGLFGEPAVAP